MQKLYFCAAQSQQKSLHMLSNRLKKRLLKDRPMTSITLRITVDVVDSLKKIAPLKDVLGYQTLFNACISDCLR